MTALHFAELMATPVGRLARILIGVALIALGLVLGRTAGVAVGVAVGVVGLVPIAAGLFNLCFIAPLLGVPFRGAKLAAH